MHIRVLIPALFLTSALGCASYQGAGTTGSGAQGRPGDSSAGAQAPSGYSGGTAAQSESNYPGNAGAQGPSGEAANGEDTYKKVCSVCHAAGVAGAPKLGDKADWGPRIAQGKDTLYTHALNGFQGKKGVMPPKGGNSALSDADVKAAVDYMASQAK